MKLVLMSCCAPCSAGAIKQLADGQIPGVDDFIVLFFNPNIFPAAEYDKRLAEQIRYCEQLGAKYAIGEYDHAAWRDAVRGMEDAPESVFGVSRHKDQSQVDRAGYSALSDQYIPIKWDEGLRCEINRASDFYRQKYCGCEFSMRRDTEKSANIKKIVPIR